MTTSATLDSNIVMDEPVDLEIARHLNLESPRVFFCLPALARVRRAH